jgi:hypothetical protein
MPDRRTRTAVAVLDLTIGTAAAGASGVRRGVGVMTRLAAPAAGVASRAEQAAADRLSHRLSHRLSYRLASRLAASGQRQRSRAQDAALRRLQVLVPRVVDAVLDQIDLTELVVRRVDLDRVTRHLDIDGIVARVDVDGVAARLDLIGLAERVVDGIDLPRIIRESSGSVASEGIRGVRMQSIEADQAVARFVDRLLLRRGSRRIDSGQSVDGDRGGRPAAPGRFLVNGPDR